jgi:hypothetical protein
MNTLVTISQAVWPYEGRRLVIDVTAEGVVYTDATSYLALPLIPWDKVDNMEFLAEEFREMKVYEFRALVTALGKAYPYKTTVTND